MKKLLLVLTMLFSLSGAVLADNGEYLVLGSDLNPQERETVLELLDVDNINDYNVSYITNADEYAALGNYLPAEVIGSRALSSVKLSPNSKGINVETENINYVSKEMYQNALITAGLKNVNMKAVGPYPISGTAALVAAIQAYETMTGESINDTNANVANEELVTTQDLADEVGQEKAAELVASLKQQVLSNNYTEEEIYQALDDLSSKMNITISPEVQTQIVDLMKNVQQIDIDPNAIRDQAQNIYNQIQDYVNSEEGGNFINQIVQSVKNFIDTIVNFFRGEPAESGSEVAAFSK